MIITVRNYRGMRSGEVVVDRLALIAGCNGAGKSSFCEAAEAALTGTAIPLQLTKKDAGLLVTTGAECGAVTVQSDDLSDMVSVAWPRAEVSSEGTPPTTTPVAAGRVKMLDLDDKGRAALMVDALGAAPSRDDLLTGLTVANVRTDAAEAIVPRLWASIEQNGWDATHKQTGELSARTKGRWEQVTGRSYGHKVAATWRPEAWEADLETAKEKDLVAAVTLAEVGRNGVIAAAAGTSGQLKQARAQLTALQEVASKLEEGREALAAAERELREADDALAALPPVGGESGLPCPHCGGLVRAVPRPMESVSYMLVPGAEPVDRDEHDRRHKAIMAATKRLREANVRHDRVRRGVAKVEAAADHLPTLAAEVTRLEETEKVTNIEAVATAELNLADARWRLKRFQAVVQANDLADEVAGLVAALALLAPAGLRLQKLQYKLDTFNHQLRQLAGKAAWPIPEVDAKMTVTLAGRSQVLWSKSEHYRAGVLLQLALAGNADLVIIDGADILDRTGRNGLFDLLASRAQPTLVAMTVNTPALVPDLAAAGLGRSYWIEAGATHPVGQAEAA